MLKTAHHIRPHRVIDQFTCACPREIGVPGGKPPTKTPANLREAIERSVPWWPGQVLTDGADHFTFHRDGVQGRLWLRRPRSSGRRAAVMSWVRLGYRPFEGLAAIRGRFAKPATSDIRANTGVIEGAEPTVLGLELARPAISPEVPTVVTEDLPGAWLESMLFNPGTVVKVWSELDALRCAEAEGPRASPHPVHLREYGRIRRGDNGCNDSRGNSQRRRAA